MTRGWSIGEVRVDRAVEFEQPLLPPSTLLPAVTEEILSRHRSWLEPALLDPETGRLVISFHTFAIRTPRSLILVDTCSGNDRERPRKPRYHRKSWPYLENLARAGVRPEAVDYVLCTHLHVDHVGWNTRLLDGRWVPTFPNARYLFDREEWEFWQAEYRTEGFVDDPFYEDCILPVIAAGQVDFVSGNHEIDPWVRLEPSRGTHARPCLRPYPGRRFGSRDDRRHDAPSAAMRGARAQQLLLRRSGTVPSYAPDFPRTSCRRGCPGAAGAFSVPDRRQGGECGRSVPVFIRRGRLSGTLSSARASGGRFDL